MVNPDDRNNFYGVDISKWQGTVDFHALYAHANFLYAKASQSLYSDYKYLDTLKKAIELKQPMGAYHFFEPTVDARKQARFFADLVGSHDASGKFVFYTNLIPVFDAERSAAGMSPNRMLDIIYDFLNEFLAYTRKDCMIYTRASWWNVNVARSTIANRIKLWVAHYNSYINAPILPYDWSGKGYLMWQWTEKGPGLLHGVESASIDMNSFKGGKENFCKVYPALCLGEVDPVEPEPPQPPPPDPVPPEDGCLKRYKTTGNMYCRSAIKPSVKYGPTPGVSYESSSTYFVIPAGTEIVVIGTVQDGKNLWANTGYKQYVAIRYDDTTYMEELNG